MIFSSIPRSDPYSAEIKSEHPIAQAIVRKASSEGISPFEVSQFHAITGRVFTAMDQERKNIFVGSSRIKIKESSTSQHYDIIVFINTNIPLNG